jgi:hypothetical protein
MKLLVYFLVIICGCSSISMNTKDRSLTEDKVVYKLVSKESLKSGEPVKLQFILENKTDKPLFFLKWYTPFEGFNSDMFKITRNGGEIQYEGRMVKRGNPVFDDYVLISPGKSIDTIVELSLAYNLKDAGKYLIEFRGKLYDVIFASNAQEAEKLFPRSPDKNNMMDISGNTINLEIDEF